MKVCPLCAEFAPAEATFCKWCRIRLLDLPVPYRHRRDKPCAYSPVRLLSALLLGMILLNGLAFWASETGAAREAWFASHPVAAIAGTVRSRPQGAYRNMRHPRGKTTIQTRG